jgi:cell division protein ZapA (FtsZ GTPase activity inhibitor)
MAEISNYFDKELVAKQSQARVAEVDRVIALFGLNEACCLQTIKQAAQIRRDYLVGDARSGHHDKHAMAAAR